MEFLRDSNLRLQTTHARTGLSPPCIGDEREHWSDDTQPFPPVCAAVPRARLSATLLVTRSIAPTRRGLVGASSGGTFLRGRGPSDDGEGGNVRRRPPPSSPFPEATRQRQVPAKPLSPAFAAPFSPPCNPNKLKMTMHTWSFQFETQADQSAKSDRICTALSQSAIAIEMWAAFPLLLRPFPCRPLQGASAGRVTAARGQGLLGCEVFFMASSPGHPDPLTACSRFRSLAPIIRPCCPPMLYQRLASHLLQLPLHCNLADA